MSKSIVDEKLTPDDLKRLKKYEKLEKLWEETEHRNANQQTIFDEVEKNIKDLPMTNPSLADLQNPEYSHKLYHKTLRYLMRLNIPKGKDGKELRDEINLFLKEGKKTGRDGKQAYTKLFVEAVNIFKQWLNDYGGSQRVELFYRFREKNKNFS